MKTKFYLRKCSKKSTINFEFRDGASIKFRASTGFTINNEKDWDLNKQKMKMPSSTINAKLINSKLFEVESEINNLYFQSEVGAITLEFIKETFNKVFGKQDASVSKFNNKSVVSNQDSNDLINYYEWFLDFYSKNNSPHVNRILTKGTLGTIKNNLSLLKKYMVERKFESLSFNDIERVFYNDLVSYLNEKNYSRNYTGTVIQKIKTVMSYAYDEGKHNNSEFKKSYFSKMSEVINYPYLNEDELKLIEDLELMDKEADLARDIFLIECNTGLRIGDMLNFIKKPIYVFINGRKFMQVTQSKTSNIVVIPLKSTVVKIMSKYGGQLPNYLHQNSINTHLKSICKKAKIDSLYQYSRTEGGKKVTYNEPKYKFISTHTGRRSFCTNAYNAKVPVQDIMVISGHKTERVFLNYIKVESNEKAERVSKNPFFN